MFQHHALSSYVLPCALLIASRQLLGRQGRALVREWGGAGRLAPAHPAAVGSVTAQRPWPRPRALGTRRAGVSHCSAHVTDGIGPPDPNPRKFVNWCL